MLLTAARKKTGTTAVPVDRTGHGDGTLRVKQPIPVHLQDLEMIGNLHELLLGMSNTGPL